MGFECKKGGAIDELKVIYCEREADSGWGGGGGGGARAVVVSDGCYFIKSCKATSYVWDCKYGKQELGTPIILFPYHGRDNQKFAVLSESNSLYSILPAWCSDDSVFVGVNAAGALELQAKRFLWRIVPEPEGAGFSLRPAEGEGKRVGAQYLISLILAGLTLVEDRATRDQLFSLSPS